MVKPVKFKVDFSVGCYVLPDLMKEGIHSISVVNARKLVGKRNAGAQAPVFLYLYMRWLVNNLNN